MQEQDIERQVSELLGQFRHLLNLDNPNAGCDLVQCQQKFTQLKIRLIKFKLIPPFPKEQLATIKKQLTLARETYELGAFLSIEQKDESSFERYVAHLKTYYNDYQVLLGDSEWKWPILGLHLMALLAQNNISEFHTELELVPFDNQQNTNYISFPVELERWLMEGSYNKVLNAAPKVPLPLFKFFMDKLTVTVRKKMASCIEQAYEKFPINQAIELLRFQGKQGEFEAFCKERNWEVKEEISFNRGKQQNLDIPAHNTIRQSLLYATELERIV